MKKKPTKFTEDDGVEPLLRRIATLERLENARQRREDRTELQHVLEETNSQLEILEQCDLRRQPVSPLTAAVLANCAALRSSIAMYLDTAL